MKFLEVKLQVPLTESQAQAIGDISDFSPTEWKTLVAEAVRYSYLRENETIVILDTRVIDTDAGIVLPEILP